MAYNVPVHLQVAPNCLTFMTYFQEQEERLGSRERSDLIRKASQLAELHLKKAIHSGNEQRIRYAMNELEALEAARSKFVIDDILWDLEHL